MANTNCSNIADTISINITNTDLPPGFCHESMDATLDAFVVTMSATVDGNAASFTAGDGEPPQGDRNKLWFKQDGSSCAPLGWHWWNGTTTAWEGVPMAADITTLPNSAPPVGSIIMYGVAAAPTNWLLCDGGTFDSGTYAALATLLDDTYGTVSGTTYKLPDLRSRVPVGYSATSPDSDRSARALNASGGKETVTLTTEEIPAHTHTLASVWAYLQGTPDSVEGTGTSGTISATGSTGGGGAHENMPPFIATNFIIRAK